MHVRTNGCKMYPQHGRGHCHLSIPLNFGSLYFEVGKTRMWANAQRDGRRVEYRWHLLLNGAKFGSRPLLECRAVTLPIGL